MIPRFLTYNENYSSIFQHSFAKFIIFFSSFLEAFTAAHNCMIYVLEPLCYVHRFVILMRITEGRNSRTILWSVVELWSSLQGRGRQQRDVKTNLTRILTVCASEPAESLLAQESLIQILSGKGYATHVKWYKESACSSNLFINMRDYDWKLTDVFHLYVLLYIITYNWY